MNTSIPIGDLIKELDQLSRAILNSKHPQEKSRLARLKYLKEELEKKRRLDIKYLIT